MTHSDFNHLLSSINALSPDQMRQLIGELQRKMAGRGTGAAPAAAAESAYDLASRAGLIGDIQGEPEDSETARQLDNLRQLGRKLEAMPTAAHADGLTNRDHDRILYGQ